MRPQNKLPTTALVSPAHPVELGSRCRWVSPLSSSSGAWGGPTASQAGEGTTAPGSNLLPSTPGAPGRPIQASALALVSPPPRAVPVPKETGLLGRAATSQAGPSSVTAPAATSTEEGWRLRGRGRTGVCQTAQSPGQPFAVRPGSGWHESPEGRGTGTSPPALPGDRQAAVAGFTGGRRLPATEGSQSRKATGRGASSAGRPP
jgi:hypothetical protein